MFKFKFFKNNKRNNKKRTKINIFKFETKKTTFKNKRRKKIDISKFFKINKQKLIIYYVLWLILVVILVFSLIYWSNFSLKNINIIKEDNITNINVSYSSVNEFRNKPIFLLNQEDIKKRIKAYQENIKEIKTSIVLPDTLKINISSYKWYFNIEQNWKIYIITQNWVMVPFKSKDETLKTIELKSKQENNLIILDYKKVFNERFIENIKYLEEAIEKNLIDIKIEKIVYYEIEREAHFYINNNTILIFDINWNIESQVETLAIFNKQHLDLSKDWIIYIDLRIKDKVFYCTKEEAYNCENNLKKIYSE